MTIPDRLRRAQVWVRHNQYAAPEPPGYERDTAPFEAADVLEMQAREIERLRGTVARLADAHGDWVLHAYGRQERAEERERLAKLLDAEHERRKHLDNHAAVYARMLRESAT